MSTQGHVHVYMTLGLVQLSEAKAELAATKRDRDRWERLAKELQRERAINERLRAVILRFGETLKMRLDGKKAQAILEEMEDFQNRHLRAIQPGEE